MYFTKLRYEMLWLTSWMNTNSVRLYMNVATGIAEQSTVEQNMI